MITLRSDCLLFQLESGESMPLSPEMLSCEMAEDAAGDYDPECLHHAADAVFHYFKHELGLESVTMAEFAGAFEKVLNGVNLHLQPNCPALLPGVLQSDLRRMAEDFGRGSELFFFSRLREEVRALSESSPRVMRFFGLRNCVKQLTGAKRWTDRCQALQDDIVAFLRQAVLSQQPREQLAVVVE